MSQQGTDGTFTMGALRTVNKGIIYRGWGETTKGWCCFGLGVITRSRPEEVRESGGGGVIWRGTPYKNVTFSGDVNISMSLASFLLISG